MATAIYFHPEGYSTSGQKLMGRHAAGESFLKAYLQYTDPADYTVLVDKREHALMFADIARAQGYPAQVRVIEATRPDALADAGNVYFPGPGIAAQSWQRSHYGSGRWSLCGVTHTTSSAGAMDSLTELITAPVQLWDALICTSNAVKQHVETLLRAQAEHLRERLGIRRVVLPLLPVIPLGIHCHEFESFDRVTARDRLGIAEDDLVVLFVGRLSFHAKAHPVAMYRALDLASRQLPDGQRIVLVECGWFANTSIEAAFREGAESLCPRVRVIHLDGRDAGNRRIAWGCADVYCSFSDNIQETFGISPIEAMASGLPVVVSDWDGYKDTVRHEVDGFRIPTAMPGAGFGDELIRGYASGRHSYDVYCGLSCSVISVDIQAAADAFLALFRSPDLRRNMGEAGRRRARAVFDWSVVMKEYRQLWSQQALLRTRYAVSQDRHREDWPARMDPFKGFGHYATVRLDGATVLSLADGGVDDLLKLADTCLRLKMVSFAGPLLPSMDFVRRVLSLLERAGSGSAARLVDEAAVGSPEARMLALAWMLKVGLVRIHSMSAL